MISGMTSCRQIFKALQMYFALASLSLQLFYVNTPFQLTCSLKIEKTALEICSKQNLITEDTTMKIAQATPP